MSAPTLTPVVKASVVLWMVAVVGIAWFWTICGVPELNECLLNGFR